jgi:hypothetical protein
VNYFCPHSLGTLIEWKLLDFYHSSVEELLSPHSLGTLIEWKLTFFNALTRLIITGCPHSLGTLIEWKPCKNEELRIKNEE